MKTVNIKGKEYVLINERIKFFRQSEDFKNWSLITEIISHEKGLILIKATITDENGAIKATGLAQEKESDGFINKTSYVENCETSAWGRALGNMGIGVDASIASAEEVQTAIKNQGKKTPDKPKPKPLPKLIEGTPEWDSCVKALSGDYTLPQIESKYIVSSGDKEKLQEQAMAL